LASRSLSKTFNPMFVPSFLTRNSQTIQLYVFSSFKSVRFCDLLRKQKSFILLVILGCQTSNKIIPGYQAVATSTENHNIQTCLGHSHTLFLFVE
jgi:hypothetical protein